MLNFKEMLLSAIKKKQKPIISPEAAATAFMGQAAMKNIGRRARNLNAVNKWDVVRGMAAGKVISYSLKTGFQYKKHDSQSRKDRRLRQIAKGMIQVTPE